MIIGCIAKSADPLGGNQMNWINPKDKLPKNKKNVLVCVKGMLDVNGSYYYGLNDWLVYFDEGWGVLQTKNIDYWCEMPERP